MNLLNNIIYFFKRNHKIHQINQRITKEFKVFISLKNIIKTSKPIIKEQYIFIFYW
jgi:hypothetical protein